MNENQRAMLISGMWVFYGVLTCQTNDWGLLLAWAGLFSIFVLREDIK